MKTDGFKVQLVSADPKQSSRIVIFNVSPEVSESTQVNYNALSPTHAPGQIFAYQNTQSRTFTVSARLVSRTSREARRNLEYLNLLRGWTRPFFGLVNDQFDKTPTTKQNYIDPVVFTGKAKAPNAKDVLAGVNKELKQKLGAPPEVLLLSAYSAGGYPHYQGNIFKVPVVITSLNHTYPTDVDYIPTESRDFKDNLGKVPFPVIMTVEIGLSETHSPYEYEQFDLSKYRAGVLDGF